VGDCPFKKTWNAAPAPPALSARAAPPALQYERHPQYFDTTNEEESRACRQRSSTSSPALDLGKAQRGPRTGVSRGRGQTYNLIVEEAEVSGEVVAGTIFVHSVPVLSLFDSGASHCFIFSRFTALHSIPLECMGDQ